MAKKLTHDVLQRMTGRSRAYWFRRVQGLIAKHTTPGVHRFRYRGKVSVHGETDEAAWMAALVAEVRRHAPKSGRYDGNMWIAAVVGLILSHWFIRIQRAKTMDPRRPKHFRRRAYASWVRFNGELLRVVFDESEDPRLLPGQRWENPYDPRSKDGRFV